MLPARRRLVLNERKNDESRSWDSSGNIVPDYGLDNRAIGVRSPAVTKEFFL
jgi:hypothetical protein